MSKASLFSVLSAATLTLGLMVPAGVASVVVTPGQLMSTQSGVSTADFDSGTLPSGFTTSGNAGVVSGSLNLVYSQPANDTTHYAYTGSGGSMTETFGAGGVNYFGLYWGSPDQYNTLTFTDTLGNTFVYGEGGTPIPEFTKVSGNIDSYVEFFDSGNNWKSVTWTSSSAAFEFDNVTSGILAAPEPASIFLLACGLVGIGAGAIRRRRLI
jgi:hypothetical protein